MQDKYNNGQKDDIDVDIVSREIPIDWDGEVDALIKADAGNDIYYDVDGFIV